MPMPMDYWSASKDFDRFLMDVRESCMLSGHNQTYHTLRAVLHVFRSHLPLDQALAFADILPPVTRAIYVEEWNPDVPVAPFPKRDRLVWEVRHVRQNHNVAPETTIEDFAGTLRRHIDETQLDRVLAGFCPQARAYWRVR